MSARARQQQRSDRSVPPLRRARIAFDLSQAELAWLAGVSLPYLEALERGDAHASAQVRERFALALGVVERALFEEEAGLTATAAAKRMGVTVPTVLRAIARGELRPANSGGGLDVAALPDELDTGAVARLAGVSHRAVNAAIRRGALPARRDEHSAWRIGADAALAYASKRAVGKHLIPVEELDRWLAERAQKKAEHGKQARRCQHCGSVFERCASAPGSQRYCSLDCYTSARRAPLLAAAGACGSPTCREHGCTVQSGLCHRPGCDQPAFIATHTRRDSRWVRAHATVYCSSRCAVLARNAGLPWVEQYGALKQAGGLLDAREVGRLLDRSPQAVMGHARRLGVGQRLNGLGHAGMWLFTTDDVDTIGTYVAQTPWGSQYRDPERRARWHLGRHGTTGVFGRKAAEIAASRGKKVGRPGTSPELVARVLGLRRESKSQQQIAYLLKISRGQVRGVIERSKAGRNPL